MQNNVDKLKMGDRVAGLVGLSIHTYLFNIAFAALLGSGWLAFTAALFVAAALEHLIRMFDDTTSDALLNRASWKKQGVIYIVAIPMHLVSLAAYVGSTYVISGIAHTHIPEAYNSGLTNGNVVDIGQIESLHLEAWRADSAGIAARYAARLAKKPWLDKSLHRSELGKDLAAARSRHLTKSAKDIQMATREATSVRMAEAKRLEEEREMHQQRQAAFAQKASGYDTWLKYSTVAWCLLAFGATLARRKIEQQEGIPPIDSMLTVYIAATVAGLLKLFGIALYAPVAAGLRSAEKYDIQNKRPKSNAERQRDFRDRQKNRTQDLFDSQE